MKAWRLPCGWRLLFFVFLGLLGEGHGSGDKAVALPSLFPTEVRALRLIAAKIRVSHWNFSIDPCNSGGRGGFGENVKCDCSFYNHTMCHVTDIFLRGQNLTGELPPDFADLPNLLQLQGRREGGAGRGLAPPNGPPNVLIGPLNHPSSQSISQLGSCISNTKSLLSDLRNDGWEPLLEEVKAFCDKHEIEISDLNRKYVDVTKSRNKNDNTTTLHHYKIDVFNVAVDQQLIELEDRFSSQATKLLSLCASLDPRKDGFDISKISTLVEKYYPADFSSQDQAQLECQLPHFQLDVCNHLELSTLPSLADLTKGLVRLGKNAIYPMVDRLLRLVITLPVSTATIERVFSVC